MNVKSLSTATAGKRTPWLPRSAGHRAASWLLTALTLVAFLTTAVVWSTAIGSSAGEPVWFAFALMTAAVSFAILMVRGHFRSTMLSDATTRLSPTVASVAMGGCFAIVAVSPFPADQPDFDDLAGLFASLVVVGLASHLLGVRLLRRLWARGRMRSSALVYGADELANELAIEIGLRPDYGVDVVGFIANTRTLDADLPGPIFDPDTDLAELVGRTGADRLIIAPGTEVGDRRAIRAARLAASAGVPVFVVPRFFEMGLGMNLLAPDRARGYPLVRLQRSAHPQLSIRLKRLFDVAVSSTLLLLTSPLVLAIAIAIKATSRGPILFSQDRLGQHGRPIVIRKFRSMRASESSDTDWTADDRVTLLGRWLRRLNLDEIPQLYSVLVGDMSLVGPRPERPVFVAMFRREVVDYDFRHRMPAGITGLAQIIGLRGDTSITERIKYDNLYIDQWSFRADLQILAKTTTAIWRQRSNADRVIELERALDAAGALPDPPQRVDDSEPSGSDAVARAAS